MRLFVQASSGGFAAPAWPATAVDRVAAVAERAGAEAIIAGWGLATDYTALIDRVRRDGRRVYLWLPVFSEYGPSAHPARDQSGRAHRGAVSDAGDDFRFACPSQTANIDLVLSQFDRHFAAQGFDGVMLDKIRFSSFGNGFAAGLGCLCRRCRRYYAERGVDIPGLIARLEEADKPWLTPAARHGFRYDFADRLIDDFYRARARLITEAVATIVGYLRTKHLSVGLDVFAPALADLVGQDLAELAGLADFIKPMTYRVTDAPAGIPYELAQLKTELAANGCPIGSRLEELWAVEDLAGPAGYAAQLDLLAGLDCPVLPGVEVNRLPFCATSPAYVEASLAAIEQAGLAGAVLSWNVLAEVVYPAFN